MERQWTFKGVCLLSMVFFLVGCPGGGGSGSSSSVAERSEVSAPLVEEENDVPEAPEQLACSTNSFDVFVSWRNAESYSEIRVDRDGERIVVLGGAAETFTESLDATGDYTYEISAVDDEGTVTDTVSCSVEVREIATVSNLQGTFITAENRVELGWDLPAGVTYDTIRVIRNDVFLEAVAGAVTLYYDDALAAGVYSYEIRGVIDGKVSAPAMDSVLVSEFGQITGLDCDVDTQTGSIDLSWQNGESYDSIDVFCGGELVATLDGDQTSYEHNNEIYGIFSFELQATLGVRQTETVSCESSVGRLAWDADTSGLVAGYYVYVWDASESTPENTATDAQCSIDVGTSVTLVELFSLGVLPDTALQTDLKIALASFDSQGNISELSNIVDCPWYVLSSGGMN